MRTFTPRRHIAIKPYFLISPAPIPNAVYSELSSASDPESTALIDPLRGSLAAVAGPVIPVEVADPDSLRSLTTSVGGSSGGSTAVVRCLIVATCETAFLGSIIDN